MYEPLTHWAKTPAGGRVLRTVACALIGVSLGLAANLAAREKRTTLAPESTLVATGFALGAKPLETLPVGASLKGELAFGAGLNPVVVYFRTTQGSRFKYQLESGTPGYLTAAFQASFAHEASGSVVSAVELVVEQTRHNAKRVVFSRGPEPFLEVGLPG